MDQMEKAACKFFSKIDGVVSIFLFGSYAKEKEQTKSDVDLAILFQRSNVPSISTLIEWRESLSEILQKDVDLVCLNTASPILGMQVHTTGKALAIYDEKEYANYQMVLFTDYAELKELRAPMEKDILKRKYYD